MKNTFTLVVAAITVAGGKLMQLAFFPTTMPGEESMLLPCIAMAGILMWFICRIMSRHLGEAAAVRMAAYEARRDAIFDAANADEMILKYESYRADFLEGRKER